MKRIAAIAAVVLALLAVPATAMASTTWGGPQPPRHHPGPPGNCQTWGGVGGMYCCPVTYNWGDRSQNCQQQTVTFSMRAFSSTATEDQGPRLVPGEVVIYQHHFYTIGSVWYRHFTLDQGGSQFTNGPYPIWYASATVLTGQWSFQNNQ
jgi:hypothetical protein